MGEVLRLCIQFDSKREVSRVVIGFNAPPPVADFAYDLKLNSSQDTFLVSAISTIFKTDQRYILPEYLMLFFKRDEFDRYARFNSWGSARENFSFDEMQNVEIPIPDISIQQSIVDIYHVYMTRKSINEKLKAQIKNICPILIIGSLEEGREIK